jgi:hypothetical protein
MLDRVVIVVRQSPDWASLSRDWRAGLAIDPQRYQPPRAVPDFPDDITALIARWNAASAVDFFTCRQSLKAIAQVMLGRIERAMVVDCAELPRAMAELEGARFMLFFCDDDDWYAPELFSMLSAQDFSNVDVAVFPFVRLGWQTCTFEHPAARPPASIGTRRDFLQRYHTNNYGLTSHMWQPAHLAAMQDHFDASAYADRMGFVDRQLEQIVGATNKTPCAASFLRATVAEAPDFAAAIAAYVRELRGHAIPDALGWLREPVAMTIVLFEAVLAAVAVA